MKKTNKRNIIIAIIVIFIFIQLQNKPEVQSNNIVDDIPSTIQYSTTGGGGAKEACALSGDSGSCDGVIVKSELDTIGNDWVEQPANDNLRTDLGNAAENWIDNGGLTEPGTLFISSSSGNDANDGSSSSTPIKTLNKLSTMTLQPGDIIKFKCGDTWLEKFNYQTNGNGINGNPITFDEYGACTGNNRPIISGGIGIDQQGYSSFFGARQYININNLEFRNAMNNGLNIYNSNNIKLSNCIFSNNYNHAIGITDSNNIYLDNCYFDTNGLKMNVEHTGGETIWIANSNHVYLTSNQIIKSGGVPIDVWHSSFIDIVKNKISECTAPDGMWEAGIYFDGSSDSKAQSNYVSRCHVGYSSNSEISGFTSNRIVFDKNIGYNNNVNLVLESNLGSIVNNYITVTSNTFVKDISTGTGGYSNDLILKAASNLIFKDNIIADYSTGTLLTTSNTINSNYANNLWYSSSNNYPTITQLNSINIDPLFIDKITFKPKSGIASTMSSTGSYVGAVPPDQTIVVYQLSNGGFENGTTGWAMRHGFVRDTTTAHSGTASVKTFSTYYNSSQDPTLGDARAIWTNSIYLTEGQKVFVSWWAKAEGPYLNCAPGQTRCGEDSGVRLGIDFKAINSTPFVINGQFVHWGDNNGDWVYNSFNTTVPYNKGIIRINLWLQGKPNNYSANGWFDDINLTISNTTLVYS